MANTLDQRTRGRDGFLSLDIIAGGAWRLKIYRETGEERKFLPPPQRNPGYRRCFLPHTAGCFGLRLTQRSGETPPAKYVIIPRPPCHRLTVKRLVPNLTRPSLRSRQRRLFSNEFLSSAIVFSTRLQHDHNMK